MEKFTSSILDVAETAVIASITIQDPALGLISIPVVRSIKDSIKIILDKNDESIENKEFKEEFEKSFLSFVKKGFPEIKEEDIYQYINKSYEIISFLPKEYENISDYKFARKDIQNCVREYQNTENCNKEVLKRLIELFYLVNLLNKSSSVQKEFFTIYEINELIQRMDNFEKNKEGLINKERPEEDNEKKEYDYFVGNYTRPLYLHCDNKDVTLEKLYVAPKISEYNTFHNRSISIDVFLEELYKKNSYKPLVLLGSAGSGKSSIVSRLVYFHFTKKELYANSNRDLIALRLRKLPTEKISLSLFAAICDFLNVSGNEKEYFENKDVILDGFDELFLIERNYNWKLKLDQLFSAFKNIFNSRLIITSRPSDFFKQNENNTYYLFYLKPYDKYEKTLWIEKYEENTKNKIDNIIRDYILRDNKVFIYPQLLYLIAGQKQGSQWDIDNLWSLYHQIFYNELYIKEYDHDHYNPSQLQLYKEPLYILTKKIAYEMSKYSEAEDKHSLFFLEKEGLSDLIDQTISELENLADYSEDNLRQVLKYGQALCCFYNEQNSRGMIEFYHNNIRDYFIAEYLFDELNRIFSYNKREEESKDLVIEKKLFKLLGENPISESVIRFVELRSFYERANNEYSSIRNFLSATNKKEKVYDLINNLTKNKEVYNENSLYRCCCIEGISNFLNNFVSIITAIDNGILLEKNRIDSLLLSINSFSRKERFCYISISSEFLKQTSKLNICYANLKKSELRLLDFEESILIGSDFSGCDLPLTSFRGANLSESNFEYANLCEACFTDAIVLKANFYGAQLDEAELRGAIMEHACMDFSSLINADLEGINLVGASLIDTLLGGANFSDANMYKADLSGADLDLTNLSGANLKNADLTQTNLTATFLDGANLEDANLINAHFDSGRLKKARNYDKAIYSLNKDENKNIIEKIKNS